MSDPLVSVVITTYNTGRYLPETLASVFAQTHHNYEVIVVDDGSRDDTVARAREFTDRITLLERAHEGLGAARNAGIDQASGDYLAFLDSDDLWIPETLRTQVALARQHPGSGLIVSDGTHHEAPHLEWQRLFDRRLGARIDDAADGQMTGPCYRAFLTRNLVSCPAQALIPRWASDAVGPVCRVPDGPQDYDYYLRLTLRFPATFHRASLARWRFRADSMSGDLARRDLRWAIQAIEVLTLERSRCPAEDRSVLDTSLATNVHASVRRALSARMHGIPVDDDDLARLVRAQPRNPAVIAGRALLAFPAPVGRAVLRSARSARELTRRGRATPAP